MPPSLRGYPLVGGDAGGWLPSRRGSPRCQASRTPSNAPPLPLPLPLAPPSIRGFIRKEPGEGAQRGGSLVPSRDGSECNGCKKLYNSNTNDEWNRKIELGCWLALLFLLPSSDWERRKEEEEELEDQRSVDVDVIPGARLMAFTANETNGFPISPRKLRRPSGWERC